MSGEQQFGGEWTLEKLDMFSNYIKAYLYALKNWNFNKIYIDAFAGTGYITSRDGTKTVAGSAKLVLSNDMKFDHYYFIESNHEKANELTKMVDREFLHLKDRITVLNGDANEELDKICKSLVWNSTRGVLFLDPYATQVAWKTLDMIASISKLDVWYLFPIQALQRLLQRDRKQDKTWIKKVDELLGSHEWYNLFYEESQQMNLFNTTEMVKSVDTEGLKKYIVTRLKTIFSGVSSKPRLFCNSKNSPIFLFCFAVSNSSKSAYELALKIANYILKEEK